MGDSEKSTALKKVYADIILNSAKEAAARIIVSERKALRYQHELFATKEESLRMLLRLKQMLDSKVSEAAMKSLTQQRKIEELEAQLHEAEDIVRDLREELTEVQDELEKVQNNHLQRSNEKNVEVDIATQEQTSQGNRPDASGSIIPTLPDSWPEPFAISDMKNSTLNGTSEGNKCYSANCSHMTNCYICNPDFASIVMRRKEPELYRNGCTQRIRAFERNLLSGQLHLSGQAEDVKNETFIRGDEGRKGVCVTPIPKVDNMSGVYESIVTQMDSSTIQVQAVKSFRRKRKRATRNQKSKASSLRYLPGQVMCPASDISCSKPSSYLINDNDQSGEKSSKLIECASQKDPESPSAPKLLSNTTEKNVQSRCVEVTERDAEFLKACSVQSTINSDKVLVEKLELTRQIGGSAESSEVPSFKSDLETVNTSLANSDLKESDLYGRVPGQTEDKRFLKYIFQRKRKKGLLNSSDGNSSLENSIMNRKSAETQNGSPEPQNSSLITESSRDSRRVAQVARQLISLSEKKW